MPLRPLLSAACLAALIAVSVRFQLLTLPFVNRAPIERAMTILPDRGAWSPDYPKFLEAVRERTARGDSIALMVPARSWESGYAYAYYRASYFLAGRTVLPVMLPNDRRLPENLNRSHYVAFWPGKAPAGANVVFAGFRGALVRR